MPLLMMMLFAALRLRELVEFQETGLTTVMLPSAPATDAVPAAGTIAMPLNATVGTLV